MQATELTKKMISPLKENSWRSWKRSQKAYKLEFIFHNTGTTLFWQMATEQLSIHSCIISRWKQSFLTWKSNFIGALMIFPYNAQKTCFFLTEKLHYPAEWDNKQEPRDHKCLWGLDFHIWVNGGTMKKDMDPWPFCKALSYVLPYVRQEIEITHPVAMG